MFRKECREIWWPVLLRLLVVLVLPLSMLAASVLERGRAGGQAAFLSLISTFQIFLIWVANYLGVTSFKSEYENKAFEYWLTLPQRSLRRIVRKTAARLITILLFSALFTAIYFIGSQRAESPSIATYAILRPVIICPLTVLIYMNGCLCGFLDSRNLRALFNVVTFFSWLPISMGLARLPLPLLRDRPAISVTVNTFAGLLLVILLSAGSLWPAARKLDLRSPTRYGKIVKVFNLPILLGLDVLALFLIFGGGQK